MNDALFKPHGNFSCRWYGDVLYSSLNGVFNREAIAAYLQALQAQVAGRGPAPWGRIADMRLWGGATPDAAQLTEDLARWIKSSNCIVSVQVFSEAFFQTVAANAAKRVSPRNLNQVLSMNEAIAVMRNYDLDLGKEAAELLGL